MKSHALEFWFDPVDVDLVIRDAVQDLIDAVLEGTTIAPLMGFI